MTTTTRLSDVHMFAVTAADHGWHEAQRFSRTNGIIDVAYEKAGHRLDINFRAGAFQVAQHTAPGIDKMIDTPAGVYATLTGA